MLPRAGHTKYGERWAKRQTPEDWHRAGDHAEHGDAGCSICVAEHYPEYRAADRPPVAVDTETIGGDLGTRVRLSFSILAF